MRLCTVLGVSNAYGHGHGFNQIELHVTSQNVQEDRGNAVAEARDPGCSAKMNEIVKIASSRSWQPVLQKKSSLLPSFKVPREDAQSERVEAFHSGVPDLNNFHRNRSPSLPSRRQSVTPPASCTPPHSSSSSSMPISGRHHKAQARRTGTSRNLQNLQHHKLEIFAHTTQALLSMN